MKREFEVKVKLPIRTVSELNQRDHWAVKHRRVKTQKREVGYSLIQATNRRPTLPCDVWLTRIAPRELDEGDNLNGSFKAIRDAIAHWMGVDDRSKEITWKYNQRKGKTGEYAVIIEVYSDGYV